jgi:hypothetical protein
VNLAARTINSARTINCRQAAALQRCGNLERTITMRKLIALLLVGSLMALGCGRSYAPTSSKGKNTEIPKSGGAAKPADDKPQNTD